MYLSLIWNPSISKFKHSNLGLKTLGTKKFFLAVQCHVNIYSTFKEALNHLKVNLNIEYNNVNMTCNKKSQCNSIKNNSTCLKDHI